MESKGVRGTETGVLRRQIVGTPGWYDLRKEDIWRHEELGEHSWGSEHPNIWDHKDPRKQTRAPGTRIPGVLRSQGHRDLGF